MSLTILHGDCIEMMRSLPAESVHCCVTSPPYWGLRDYGVEGQLGSEATPEEFVDNMVAVFDEVARTLRPDGTLWLNLGDGYCGRPGGFQGSTGQRASRTFTARTTFRKKGNGLKNKDLVGMPWRVAFALQQAGWYLRCDIIWHKPNPMPESVTDRPTKAHEYLFLLTKSERYYYNAAAIREPLAASTYSTFGHSRKDAGHPDLRLIKSHRLAKTMKVRKPRLNSDGSIAGANKRSVWTIASTPYKEAHFATFPADLVKPCILAGSPAGGTVLDPFGGSGTTGQVALELGRRAILCELNPFYVELARSRCNVTPGFVL